MGGRRRGEKEGVKGWRRGPGISRTQEGETRRLAEKRKKLAGGGKS